jgi:hypothetical protein
MTMEELKLLLSTLGQDSSPASKEPQIWTTSTTTASSPLRTSANYREAPSKTIIIPSLRSSQLEPLLSAQECWIASQESTTTKIKHSIHNPSGKSNEHGPTANDTPQYSKALYWISSTPIQEKDWLRLSFGNSFRHTLTVSWTNRSLWFKLRRRK